MNISRQAAGVGYSNFRDDPVTVTLMIYGRERGNRFDMDILISGQRKERLPIAMTLEDLNELNELLRKRMNKVIVDYVNKNKQDLAADLAALANTGKFAFGEVFSDPQAQRAMLDLSKISDNIIFEINSDDFSLPWELLYYPEASPAPPSFNKFWGMKHIISRVINRENRPFVSPKIEVHTRPRLGLLAYSELTGVSDLEIPFFEQLKKDGKIRLVKMPSLDPTPAKKDIELDKFKKFWDRKFNIAHFACHASTKGKPSVESFIQLSNGICITLLDLKQAEITIREYPLVILNACETAQLCSMNTRYFAGDFIKYGARGVVATEHAVPDQLAFEFTREIYGYLLDGMDLGKSIFETRKQLLKHGNPIGLMYSLYAPPATRIEYTNH
jgi:hypothetical protein